MSKIGREFTVHALLHAAQPAICNTNWAEMTGDDCIRTCPQCAAVVFHVDRMEPETFCTEANKIRLKQGFQSFRRADGTYTFSNRNCSPKAMLESLRSDLRGVSIAAWWSDRYGRYNQYLATYGLIVGGGASLLIVLASLFSTSNWLGIVTSAVGSAIVALLIGAILSAIAANMLFALCVVVNLLVPGVLFLAPVRRNLGPWLMVASMGIMGFVMSIPLIGIGGSLLSMIFRH